MYELARKHCGNQKTWSIHLESLFVKSGSKDRLAKFKASLKTTIRDGHIPDYQYTLDEKDKVTVTKTVNIEEPFPKKITLHEETHDLLSKLSNQTIQNANKIHKESFTDWSLKEIAVQFYQFIQKKGMPKNLDGAFIGFLKKKVRTYKKDALTT